MFVNDKGRSGKWECSRLRCSNIILADSVVPNPNSPQYDARYLRDTTEYIHLNYGEGTSKFCLDLLVQNDQLIQARKDMLKNKDEGQTLKQKLEGCKKMTSAGIFLAGIVKLGGDVFDRVKENIQKKRKEENNKVVKAENLYKIYKSKAEKVVMLNLTPEKMLIDQLIIMLNSLKQSPKDGAIPKKKDALIATYNKWKNRPPPVFVIDRTLVEDDNTIRTGNTAVNNNNPPICVVDTPVVEEANNMEITIDSTAVNNNPPVFIMERSAVEVDENEITISNAAVDDKFLVSPQPV